jgi:hypothetical protein
MVNLSSLPLSFFIAFVASVASASPADDSIVAFRIEIATTPATAPAIITRTLRAAGAQAPALAGPLAAAAIENIGVNPAKRQISSVVFATVHAVPDSVLDIVRAGVIASPRNAAVIAAAAAAAVPHPWKQVIYRRPAPVIPAGVPGIPAAGTSMTLAEAIVQTAFDAQAGPLKSQRVGERDFKGEPDFKEIVQGLSTPEVPLAAIQSAVDAALVGDPGLLLSQIGDPRGISGVGIVGGSNFANEPPVPTPPPKSPPPVTPDPPAVSQ